MAYEEIRPGIHHFRAREIGKTRNPNGTYSRITVGETYIETKRGLIREDEWAKIAYQMVVDNGDMPLLDAIENHVREHCVWLKEKEIRPYALECLTSEAYKAWKNFGGKS